jgi:cell wall-associated NlpC family hydrolase
LLEEALILAPGRKDSLMWVIPSAGTVIVHSTTHCSVDLAIPVFAGGAEELMPIRAFPLRIVETEKPRPVAPPSRLRRLRSTVEASSCLRIVGIAGYSVGVVAVSMAIAGVVHGPGHRPLEAAASASLAIARPEVTTTRPRLTTTVPATSTMPPSPPVTPPPAPVRTTRPAARPTPSQSDIANADARKVVDWALAQLGVPYVWGGASRNGYDCSGLVMRAWQTVGVDLPHKASLQARDGVRITRAALMPGDLVISNDYGHVALYIGNGKVVQAPHTGTVVSIATLPSHGVDAYVRVNPS